MSNDAQLPAVTTIQVNPEGRFVAKTFEDSFRLARMYVASGMLPKRFQTPESVVTAQQFAAEIGIQGITALRQIAVINGSPALFGDLPLAVVRGKGLLESIDEYLVTKDGTKICLENKNIDQEFFAAVCTVKRKGELPRTVIFSTADAKTAKIWGTNVWAVYPKRMIMMKARGQALKDIFPDALSGISQGEYDFDTVIETVVENEVVNSSGPNTPQAGAAKLNSLVAAASTPVVEPAPDLTEPTVIKPTTVLPAETNALPAQDDFESFRGVAVGPEPKIEPRAITREELSLKIGNACEALGLDLDGLTAKCQADFKKKPTELNNDELLVILTVLEKQIPLKKGK